MDVYKFNVSSAIAMAFFVTTCFAVFFSLISLICSIVKIIKIEKNTEGKYQEKEKKDAIGRLVYVSVITVFAFLTPLLAILLWNSFPIWGLLLVIICIAIFILALSIFIKKKINIVKSICTIVFTSLILISTTIGFNLAGIGFMNESLASITKFDLQMSDYATALTGEGARLDTPKNMSFDQEEMVIRWDEVEGAVNYQVVINENEDMIYDTAVNYFSYYGDAGSTFQYKIRAIPDTYNRFYPSKYTPLTTGQMPEFPNFYRYLNTIIDYELSLVGAIRSHVVSIIPTVIENDGANHSYLIIIVKSTDAKLIRLVWDWGAGVEYDVATMIDHINDGTATIYRNEIEDSEVQEAITYRDNKVFFADSSLNQLISEGWDLKYIKSAASGSSNDWILYACAALSKGETTTYVSLMHVYNATNPLITITKSVEKIHDNEKLQQYMQELASEV